MSKNKKYVDPNNGASEEYKNKLLEIEKEGVDPFSKEYLTKFDKKEIVLETNHWFVFQNQHPYKGVDYQFVIVVQEYKEHFSELTTEEKIDLYSVADMLCNGFFLDGGALTMRFGNTKKSGATVTRLHAQLIVPKKGEKVAAWFGSHE